MTDIKIPSFEGTEFNAYCASPSKAGAAALLVIHDVFGVNGFARKACDDFAASGYFAICPDLFWRNQQAQILGDQDLGTEGRMSELVKKFEIEAALRDLLSTLAKVRVMPGCNGKVGVVGYGLGGRLAFLLASRSDVDVSVCYYGRGLEKNIDDVHDVSRPLLVHFAAKDSSVPENVQNRILQRLGRNSLIATKVHENVGYGFALPDSPSYDQSVATVANKATKEFLARSLAAGASP